MKYSELSGFCMLVFVQTYTQHDLFQQADLEYYLSTAIAMDLFCRIFFA